MNPRSLVAPLAFASVLLLGVAGCSDDPVSTPATTNVRVLTNVKISAQASTITGHLYDVEKDTAYAMNFYSSRKTEIDFVYYFGYTGDSAAIVSPDYDSLSFGSVAGNYSGYITDAARVGANTTRFKKPVGFTIAQFDAINDSATIAQAFANGGTELVKASRLKIGDVVAFRTAAGTDGIFKVTDFFANSPAGYVTITVKTKK